MPGFQQGDIYKSLADRYEMRTGWGRPQVHFGVLDRLSPEVMRGISPIASAISRCMDLDKLTDVTLDQLKAQAQVAWSLVTDMPHSEAKGIFSAEEMQELLLAHLDVVQKAAEVSPIPRPGGSTVAVLPPGSKLSATTTNATSQGYDTFTKRLLIELSRAFGLSYSELTGDYSEDSFSSSRMAAFGPWSLTIARRESFVVPAYNAAYECVIEEAVQRGLIKLPRGAAEFQANRQLWTKAAYFGPSRPAPDPAKEAAANNTMLANGTKSRTQIAAENGHDWRETIHALAKEKEYAEACKIDISPSTKGGGNK